MLKSDALLSQPIRMGKVELFHRHVGHFEECLSFEILRSDALLFQLILTDWGTLEFHRPLNLVFVQRNQNFLSKTFYIKELTGRLARGSKQYWRPAQWKQAKHGTTEVGIFYLSEV